MTDWSEAVLAIVVFGLIIMFWGTPDLHDVLIQHFMGAKCP